MMLALQLVAASAVFLSVATAQMSVILDDTSKTLDQWTSDEDTSERESVPESSLLALLQPHQQEYEGSSSGDAADPGDYAGTEANLQLEEELDPGDSTENDDDDEDYNDDDDGDFDNDMDLDSEEDEDSSEESQGGDRVKRKIMLGGGGSYSGVSRRRGGGDPYGRRRDNHNYHGPDYGGYYDSWPYRDRADYGSSSYGTAQTTSSASASGSADTSNSGVVYGTPVGSSASSITGASRSSGASHAYANAAHSSDRDSAVPSTSGRKSKTGRREIKQKLSKSLKWEIAEFAIQHGTHRAAEHYAEIVDRRLTPKKIEKFVSRYQKRHQKTQKRQI